MIGANGAGKSTLLKIMLGEILPTHGEIYSDFDFSKDVGAMSQDDILIEDLTIKDLVMLLCHMHDIRDIDVDKFLSLVNLQKEKNNYVQNLSGGQKRRLSFLLSILNEPKLLFLDEPTTGMDLQSIDDFWEIIKKINCATLIVTHDFNQIDNFFNRIIIMKNGEIISDKSVQEIHLQNTTIEKYYRNVVK